MEDSKLNSFTKLFSSITESTIWQEDNDTRIVWITMLAMADQHGYVGASVPGLAARARVPVESVERALEKFLSPDRYSRTPDNDGRRIAVADRGWMLLNYIRFREERSAESRRASNREASRRYRDKIKNKDDVSADTLTRQQNQPASAQAEAEAEAEIHVDLVDRPKVDPVFVHWLSVMGFDPKRAKLNHKRREKLRARRAEGYTDEQLCQAIDGCKRSEFHMGKNERKQPYNDLATILRDGSVVEQHIARVAGPFATNGVAVGQRISSI